jgi:hypothetical protein
VAGFSPTRDPLGGLWMVGIVQKGLAHVAGEFVRPSLHHKQSMNLLTTNLKGSKRQGQDVSNNIGKKQVSNRGDQGQDE